MKAELSSKKKRFSSETDRIKAKIHILPFLPDDVLASHHFPDLSMISRCSPFSNGSSLESSAEPGSIFQFNTAERKLGKTIEEKKTYSQTAPQLAMGLPLAVDFPLEPWLERWPLARSDSGLGHQCERLRFGLLSMEYCMLCPRKDRS